jgi:hypothetical protein
MSNGAENGHTFFFEDPSFFDIETWREEIVDTADIILEKFGGDRNFDGDLFKEYFWTSDDLRYRYELRRDSEEGVRNYWFIIFDWDDDDNEAITEYYFNTEEHNELAVEGEDQAMAVTLGDPLDTRRLLCEKLSGYLDNAPGYNGKDVQNWPGRKVNRVFSDMMVHLLSEDQLIVDEVISRRKLSQHGLGFYDTILAVKDKYKTKDDELLRRAYDIAEQKEEAR